MVLVRLLQERLGKKYSVGKIIEILQKCNCSHIQENYWLFNYTDDLLANIGKTLNINFEQKFMRLQDIKNILSNTKKQFVRQQ